MLSLPWPSMFWAEALISIGLLWVDLHIRYFQDSGGATFAGAVATALVLIGLGICFCGLWAARSIVETRPTSPCGHPTALAFAGRDLSFCTWCGAPTRAQGA